MAKRNIRDLKVGDKLKFGKSAWGPIEAGGIYTVSMEYTTNIIPSIAVKTEGFECRHLTARSLNDLKAKLVK